MRQAALLLALGACSFFKSRSVALTGRVTEDPAWDPHTLSWPEDDTGTDDTGGDDTGGDDTGGDDTGARRAAADALVGLAGAVLTVRDPDEREYSVSTSGDDGAFSVDLPEGSFFTLVAEAEGRVPTGFSGTAGLADAAVDDGKLWVSGQARLDGLRETFATCPDVNATGGVLEGEVRLYISGYSASEVPRVTTATVSAVQADGATLQACYLDDSGQSSADATVTGQTGRFAVFGVMEGPVVATVTYTVGAETSDEFYWFGWMPGGGLAPLYPFYVDLL